MKKTRKIKKKRKNKKKTKSKKINIILIVILSVSLIVLAYFITQYKIYQDKNNKLVELRKDYIELEKENEVYITLKNNYLATLDEENKLGTNNKNINTQINNLNKDIDTLKKQIEETNKKIKAIS